MLIAHENQRFSTAVGLIDSDAAFAEAPAMFTALLWRPQLGMRLAGTITLSSPSHVSLLVHGTFNAAISAPHLSSDWEFCHYEDGMRDFDDRSVGYWRNRRTHERLGGDTQTLEFTVISMTVANHMLSLHGSLLDDPFSIPPPRPGSLEFELAVQEAEDKPEPEHVPEIPAAAEPRRVRWDDSESEPEETGAEDQVPQVAESEEQAGAQEIDDTMDIEKPPTKKHRSEQEQKKDKKEKKKDEKKEEETEKKKDKKRKEETKSQAESEKEEKKRKKKEKKAKEESKSSKRKAHD